MYGEWPGTSEGADWVSGWLELGVDELGTSLVAAEGSAVPAAGVAVAAASAAMMSSKACGGRVSGLQQLDSLMGQGECR